MGERTEMYYMPQMSPLPAELTVEAWAADRAVELIKNGDDRPFFGQLSFIGPHPPFTPPMPFHRMYDPDRMPPPISGDRALDHLDQHLPWMNSMVFAEDVDQDRVQALKVRYFGEISYIDGCIGKVLDAIDTLPDPDNVLICFVSDHGDLLVEHPTPELITDLESTDRTDALIIDEAGRTQLWTQPYEVWERHRIYQLDLSRGVTGFPDRPEDVHYEPPATSLL
ncbi:MAG TPA: sulfatase-like hydrolase/transferase [Microlunatus sp.]